MNWIRLFIILEGQTEETFVNEVLVGHLAQHQVIAVPKLIQTGKSSARRNKGGFRDYGHLKRDLERWIKQDQNPDARFTTMVDLYAYPKNAPGYTTRKSPDPYERVAGLETDLAADIGSQRFVPYIQLHEFETLLYADTSQWGNVLLENAQDIQTLAKSVSGFSNIELIDDGEKTAPSKRILQAIPRYDKVAMGASLALEVGLVKIRTHCRHFNEWLIKLENLATVK